MKNFRILLLGIVFLSLIYSAYSQSQDKFWLVDEAVIKPEQVANFKESLKEMVQLFKENSYPYDIQVYASTGFRYYFFRELESMDSYDEVSSATSDCWSKIDQDIFNNYVQCFKSDKQFVMKDIGKYTYRPEQQRVEWSEFKYGVWYVQFVKFDKIKEYLDNKDQIWELVKKHEFDDPILVLQGMVGTENPMYAVALFGKDAHDMRSQNQKMRESFGDEGSKLYQQRIPFLRDGDKIEFWFRRDLSYYIE
jgi:hypothetical protein